MHFLHFWGNIGGEFQDGFITRRGTLLGKKTDRGIPLQGYRAGVGRSYFQNEGKNGRFSGTVGSDEADAVTTVDLQGGILKEGASAVGFGKTGNSKHGKSGIK